jgi:hypothetical protein
LESQDSIAELERREGEWVAYAWMDPDFSAQAVAMGLIEGECDGPCDTRPGALVRLKGSRRSLRDFVADHTDQLYREWIIVWRAQEDESTR